MTDKEMDQSSSSLKATGPWPHRLAVLLCAATFPLLFVGAMVTTRQAGMAVPDWPTTFGYNMFLYPLASWFAAPWNVFVEHGHRLFGATVGLLTIALVVALWFSERRAWVIELGVVALALVIGQGVLGGMRVVRNEQLLAQIHGCVGPLFFATTVALCVFTSRIWKEGPLLPAGAKIDSAAARRLCVLGVMTTVLAYMQMLVGSQLRHVAPDASADSFRIAVWFHLILALAVVVHVIMLFIRIVRFPQCIAALRRPAAVLLVLVGCQIALGCGTWLVKYGWPAFLPAPQGWTNTAGAFWPSVLITAHVAIGSLILGTSLLVALRSLRLAPVTRPAFSGHSALEASR